MSNISSIRLSGTTYSIKDASATTVVSLTQAQYDALATKDPNTLYNITDAQGADLSQYWTSAQTESAITQATSGKVDTTTFNTYSGSVDTALSGKQDTLSAGTGIDITDNVISATGGGGGVNVVQTTGTSTTDVMSQDAVTTQLSGYVTTDTEQIISGRKIFTYTANSGKAIEFKQTGDSAKVGFSIKNSASTNNEVASFEFRPNTFTIDGVQHPLLYFGHYRNTNTANAGVPQTVIGYRQYDQKNTAAYHYLIPLPEKAKIPFSLTTSFKDYYAPIGFKNGSTMITADSTGVVDLSNEFSGKQDTLSAGTGISIVDNVISATGGGGGGGKAIEAGRGISVTTGETADTVSFNLPISAGTGSDSLVFGRYGAATGQYSAAFGNGSEARNSYAFAIGNSNYANGSSSFAGGDGITTAIASGSFAFGYNAETRGTNSVALGGCFLRTENDSEVALGNANVSQTGSTDADKTLFSVGNGTAENARHNAFEIRQNGDIYCSDGTNDVKLQDTITATVANTTALGGLKLVKLTQSEYDALTTKDNSTLYVIVN